MNFQTFENFCKLLIKISTKGYTGQNFKQFNILYVYLINYIFCFYRILRTSRVSHKNNNIIGSKKILLFLLNDTFFPLHF